MGTVPGVWAWVAGAVIVASSVAAVWTVVLAVRDRPVGNRTLVGLCVVELLVLVQLVFGIVELALPGENPPSGLTFVLYLVGALLVLPAGAFWSLAERSRAGTLVLTVACVALPVMTARVLQMWSQRG